MINSCSTLSILATLFLLLSFAITVPPEAEGNETSRNISSQNSTFQNWENQNISEGQPRTIQNPTPIRVMIHATFAVQGCLMLTGNSLLFLGIAMDKTMRGQKEYIPLAGMALADFIDGCTFVIAGTYRLLLFVLPPPTVLASGVDCMKTPHYLLLSFTAVNVPTMLLVLSIDRLLAVCFPMTYIGWGKGPVTLLTVGAYVLVVMFSGTGIVLALLSEDLWIPKYKWHCSLPFGMTKGFSAVHANLMTNFAVASVVMYAALLFVYWLKNKIDPVVSHSEQVKRQRAMTKTLGISCMFTLVFVVIPMSLRAHIVQLIKTSAFWGTVGPFTGCVRNINSMIQPLLLVKRHKDLRGAILNLACFKKFRKNTAIGSSNHA